MIFYLHYILLTSGLSGTSVLLGVYLQTYSDASQGEIGALLMSFPFVCMFVKPFFCSLADRYQAHKNHLILALTVMLIGYSPFIVIPFFPQFYSIHPRLSWFVLLLAGHVGNAGLGVAWSLGESLAVNMSHRKGTEYSRMRLMGTVSWGLYGYIIGLINEMPELPKYIPAFLTMHISVLIEIVLILMWNDDDFKMGDKPNRDSPKQSKKSSADTSSEIRYKLSVANLDEKPEKKSQDVRSYIPEEFELQTSKNSITRENNNYISPDTFIEESKQGETKRFAPYADEKVLTVGKQSLSSIISVDPQPTEKPKNLQWILFKMIFKEDGRLFKYLILFTMAGFILTPMNFLFISLSDVCKEKGCNFSRLAGSVLISQATIETLCFLIVPLVLPRVHRFYSLTFGMIVMISRYVFYSLFFYTSDISPYWAVFGEWGHGITYGIYCTIMADVALMFANLSRLFIPELRKLGLMSKRNLANDDEVEAEEDKIKVALRATMQATFGGCMDGLGGGLGSLLCGLIADWYSYIHMWRIFLGVTISTMIIYVIIEVTRSRWSDFYRAPSGSKAHEIKSLQGLRGRIDGNDSKKTEQFATA